MTLLGGSAAGAVVFQACGVPEDELLVQSSLQMPEDLVTGLDNWYATLCRQCPTSEGIVVRVIEGRAKKVEGNGDYPVNHGKHSARCEAGLQGLYDPDRISSPLIRTGDRGSGQWEEISWTDAIGRVVYQLRELQDPSGMVMVTDPVGAHMGMVVEKFVAGYGGRHLPFEPLERTNLKTAMKRVFSQDVMPDFDIQNTQHLLCFGADFLNTWISPVRYAYAYGQFRQGDRQRGTMVQVDSRFSMTGANADEWVYVNPGWEGILALSMAHVIVDEQLGDAGAADALTGSGSINLSRYAPEVVAGDVGVDADNIRHLAIDFANNRPSLAIGGGSAAAHTNGLFNLEAIYSLNYLVGSVGVPGGVIFNPPPPVKDIPSAPATASFAQWKSLVTEIKQGQVPAFMFRGADPMYGLPKGVEFEEALLGKNGSEFNVPLIVSFSGRMDDTTAIADIILPEHNYLEDWGSDVPDPGPGYQTLGFQQPVVRPFFESRGVHLGTKSFADVLLALAQGLNIDLGFRGETFKDILQEGARRLHGMGRGSVKSKNFNSFWNGILQRGGWWDTARKYAGPIPKPPRLPENRKIPRIDGAEQEFPFYLLPFASTSLTDGRGAHLPWLQATPDPITTATWRTWVEINLKIAEDLGVKEGDVVRLVSSQGNSIEVLAYPHPGVSPEVLAVPIGQGHKAGGRYAEDRGSNVLSILTPLEDDDTGALAWAATRVKIERTDQWMRLPKFENTAPDLAVDEEQLIIPLTSHDT